VDEEGGKSRKSEVGSPKSEDRSLKYRHKPDKVLTQSAAEAFDKLSLSQSAAVKNLCFSFAALCDPQPPKGG
jgi:hypothetical protein